MQKRLVVKELRDHGWRLKRCSKHEVWVYGQHTTIVAHGADIPERTAKAILRKIRDVAGESRA